MTLPAGARPTGIPGLYEHGDRELHIVLGELLHAFGYPDTPENRWLLEEQLRAVVAELWPGVPVVGDP